MKDILLYICLIVCVVVVFGCGVDEIERAICVIQPNKARPYLPISGVVTFSQRKQCFEPTLVHVHVDISGLPSTGERNYHGFHVHASNDLSDGCQSLGPHYNPLGAQHGSPWSSLSERHMGDIGNVIADASGAIHMDWYAPEGVSLYGQYSIVNRSIVLHELKDDYGLGGNAGSLSSGNAGARLACCIIQQVSSD